MKCEFTRNDLGWWVCRYCGWQYKRRVDQPPAKTCGGVRPPGPGDHLHRLIAEYFGQQVTAGCGCRDWIAQMNQWGPDGCRANRQQIVDRMIAEAKKRHWKRDNQPLLVNLATQLAAAVVPGSVAYARTQCGRLVDTAISLAESENAQFHRPDYGARPPETRPAAEPE